MNTAFETNTPQKDWLDLNAKLQKKKLSVMQKMIDNEINVAKTGVNQGQHYQYISETDYKKAFQKLLVASGLAFSSSIKSVESLSNMKNGVRVIETFTLTDIDTGFQESADGVGEGTDSLDKAVYKAQTGALKYYLANNFLVVGGDEPERDQPRPQQQRPQSNQQPRPKGNQQRPQQPNQPRPQQMQQPKFQWVAPSPEQLQKIAELYPSEIDGLRQYYKVNTIEEIGRDEIQTLINQRLQQLGRTS